MKRSTLPLRVEQLETRDLPAVYGVPWLDGSNITLSFAADGTSTMYGGSVLTQMLTPLGVSAAELEVLRAYQTWVEQANLNIGIVVDGGQAAGANGAIQGDPRFGDIRIAAYDMALDVLANCGERDVPIHEMKGFVAGLLGPDDVIVSVANRQHTAVSRLASAAGIERAAVQGNSTVVCVDCRNGITICR